MCMYVQGFHVSPPLSNWIIHLHEFVHSDVWHVGNYCCRVSRCYFDGE